MRIFSRLSAIAAVAALSLSSQAFAQSSDPSWLDDLKAQIAYDHECEVSYFLNVREGTLAGKMTFEARIQCADGRMFDASRIGENDRFEFKRCEIQVC
ncbi:MAG: hypothetical protein WBO55_00805 [Rhizobiaceae bacterium]